MPDSYQKILLDKVLNGGFKPGEMTIMMSGRQTGKSQMQAYMRMFNDVYYQELKELLLGEGTIYGSRYYTVQPVGGNWMEMEVWCTRSFGDIKHPIWGAEKAPKPEQRWYMNNSKFWFRKESDRTMFILRWS